MLQQVSDKAESGNQTDMELKRFHGWKIRRHLIKSAGGKRKADFQARGTLLLSGGMEGNDYFEKRRGKERGGFWDFRENLRGQRGGVKGGSNNS